MHKTHNNDDYLIIGTCNCTHLSSSSSSSYHCPNCISWSADSCRCPPAWICCCPCSCLRQRAASTRSGCCFSQWCPRRRSWGCENSSPDTLERWPQRTFRRRRELSCLSAGATLADCNLSSSEITVWKIRRFQVLRRKRETISKKRKAASPALFWA